MQGSFDTLHKGLITYIQFDFYGKRLATCGIDGLIKVFYYIDNNRLSLISSWQGHNSHVLQVHWSHPCYGSLLASCGADRKVIIWQEQANHQWGQIYTHEDPEAKIYCMAWCPWELGMQLAVGVSDGYVTIIRCQDNDQWDKIKFWAHDSAITCIQWAPSFAFSQLNQTEQPNMKLATGGLDYLVKIWSQNERKEFECEDLRLHNGCVRDLAWAPYLGMQLHTLASCGEDGSVVLWNKTNQQNGWNGREIFKLECPIWRVSWAYSGGVLAISSGDNTTRVLRQDNGVWTVISENLEENNLDIGN